MRLRWLILLTGIILSSIAYLRNEIINASVAFGLGISIGFFVDWLGIRKLRFWDYPREPFLGMRYFIIALPDWGLIGMIVNLLWDWIENPCLAFMAVIAVLFLTHDLPNLKTKSWRYYAPIWLVAIGWVIFIVFLRVLFLSIFYNHIV
jgi:hypothetical protein